MTDVRADAPWVVHVADEPLSEDELNPSDVLAGEPRTGSTELWSTQGSVALGIWEITPGPSPTSRPTRCSSC